MLTYYDKLPVFGEPDQDTIKQMQKAMEYGAVYGVLCADHHIGYSVPIGAAIAYDSQICVNGVGFDIGCGNKAVRVSCNGEEVRKNIYRTMNEVRSHISFGPGRVNKEKVEHAIFDEPIWNDIPLLVSLKEKAIEQLGTVGGGNHYVDIFTDESDHVWVGVHFGSRGLGHCIATHFIKQAGGKDGVHAEPVILDENSDLGEQYIKCMELAGRYAYAGRDWVCERVARILRAPILEEVHNHHNFAWKERHFDRDLWVVRKGSTPNFPGDKSFIGGSMGDNSFIVEGVESETSKATMYSTIHGAGRAIGRTAAKGKVHRKTGEVLRPGLVSHQAMADWVNAANVELRGSGVDEAPQCYKRIDTVLEAHMDTLKVIHKLTPIGVCMAGARDFDPYKD